MFQTINIKDHSNENIIQIDCTLRDGGYYNNWGFEKELINNYLKAISSTSINYVEIGFRNLSNDNFKGALAFSSDKYLQTLNLPKNIDLGVMINSSQLKMRDNYLDALRELFPNHSKETPVKLVRIACDLDTLEISLKANAWLKKKGFKVGINLTKISKKKFSDIKKISSKINESNIDVFYIADSLGSMHPKNIKEVLKVIKQSCSVALGIHTHDNLGLALSNTLAAIDNGVTWVDSTILGMGRGPGNCKTEELLVELNPGENFYSLNLVLELIDTYFNKLKEKFNWGTNPYYYICGKYEIHPSYIQEVMKDNSFGPDDKLALLEKLKSKESHDFTLNYKTNQIIEYDIKKHKGHWSPFNIFNEKDILIIASGPSSKKYSEDIEIYIKKFQPVVVGLNTPSHIPNKLINIRSACHPLRILSDSNLYKVLNQPLICPYSMLKKEVNLNIESDKIYDYGISIEEDKFKFMENSCVIPAPLVLFYTIACLISGKSRSIAITGVDGYKLGDERNEKIDKYFMNINNSIKNKIPIFSLTPSIYKNLKKKSIYGF